jgi:hypothetical protein
VGEKGFFLMRVWKNKSDDGNGACFCFHFVPVDRNFSALLREAN